MAATQTKGTVATAISSGGLGNKQSNGLIDARKKVMLDYYTCLGTEGVGSVITLCAPIPSGAVINNVVVTHDNLGAGVTYSVGDSVIAARYISGAAGSAAAKDSCALTAGIGYVIGTNAGDNQILITTAGATLTINTKLVIQVEYSFD